MKILIGNKFFYVYRGAERYIEEIISLLESKGHEVIPFSMKHPKNFPNRYEQYFVENIDFDRPRSLFSLPKDIKTGLKLIYSPEARKKISQLLDDTHPDIAHLHNIYYQLTPSILPEIKKRNIPILMTLHDHKLICPNHFLFSNGEICEKCYKKRYYHAVIRKCIKGSYAASFLDALEMYVHRYSGVYEKNVDLFVTPSVFLRSKLIEWGFDGDKITHVPYIINLDAYQPSAGSGGKYFIYLGALYPEKGVDVLVRAMLEAKDAKVLILGTGEEADRLKKMAESQGSRNIVLTGYLKGQELSETIRNSAGIIIPSICYDNSPMAIFEAMGYAKPVIASRVGGIPELVDDGKTGLLFEVGNSSDLADKIMTLHRDPEMAVEMGKKGRKKAETVFSPENNYNEIMKLYKRLLSQVPDK